MRLVCRIWSVVLAVSLLFLAECQTRGEVKLWEEIGSRQDLFISGEDGYALYRIPGLVVSARGTVLAYCEARRDRGSDWGEIDLYLRRSSDGGRTWSARGLFSEFAGERAKNPAAREQKLGSADRFTFNNPVMIASRRGPLHLLYCFEYMRCLYRRSDDDGQTWSEPRDITQALDPLKSRYPWRVVGLGPGHGLELSAGRLLIPIWLSTGTGGHAHRPSVVSSLYSDDEGQTWQVGEIAIPHSADWVNPSETVAVERRDGSVLFNARNESAQHRRLITTSIDGARGWSPPVFDPMLYEPVCMGSLISLRPSHPVWVFCNPWPFESLSAQSPSRERKHLALRVSRDEGRSWSAPWVFEPAPAAYSDLATLPDGTLLCLYERGAPPSAGIKPDPYQFLSLRRFRLVPWPE